MRGLNAVPAAAAARSRHTIASHATTPTPTSTFSTSWAATKVLHPPLEASWTSRVSRTVTGCTSAEGAVTLSAVYQNVDRPPRKAPFEECDMIDVPSAGSEIGPRRPSAATLETACWTSAHRPAGADRRAGHRFDP